MMMSEAAHAAAIQDDAKLAQELETLRADNAALREQVANSDEQNARLIADNLRYIELNQKAEADNAALRKDAERYRWINSQDGFVTYVDPDKNNEYIDAAMLAGEDGK